MDTKYKYKKYKLLYKQQRAGSNSNSQYKARNAADAWRQHSKTKTNSFSKFPSTTRNEADENAWRQGQRILQESERNRNREDQGSLKPEMARRRQHEITRLRQHEMERHMQQEMEMREQQVMRKQQEMRNQREQPNQKKKNKQRRVGFNDQVTEYDVYSSDEYDRTKEAINPFTSSSSKASIHIDKDIESNCRFSEKARQEYIEEYYKKHNRLPKSENIPLTPLNYTYPNGNCAKETCEDDLGNCWMYLGKENGQSPLAKQARIPRKR